MGMASKYSPPPPPWSIGEYIAPRKTIEPYPPLPWSVRHPHLATLLFVAVPFAVFTIAMLLIGRAVG